MPDTDGEVWKCHTNADCVEGRTCAPDGSCRGQATGGACIPTTCAAGKYSCGKHPDLCGGEIDCTPCTRDLAPVMKLGSGSGYTKQRNIPITVTVTTTNLPGGYTVRFANGDEPFAAAVPVGPDIAWALPDGDGPKKVRAKVEDEHDNAVELSDTIVLDATYPIGTVVVGLDADESAVFTRTREVTLTSTLADSGSGLDKICVANGTDAENCDPWTGATRTWSLPKEEGAHALKIHAHDKAGNITDVDQRVTLDTVAPRLAVEVVGHPAFTSHRDVTLAVTATDENEIAKLCPWNDDAEPSDADCVADVDELPWVLGDADGAREVHVRAYDRAGNTSEQKVKITLDRVPPVLALSTHSGVVVEGTRYLKTALVQLELTVDDATSKAATVELSADGASWAAPVAFAATMPFVPGGNDGQQAVWARVTDAAGLVSEPVSLEFILDTTPPIATLSMQGGPVTNSTSVTLNLVTIDVGSGPWTAELTNDNFPQNTPADAPRAAASLPWTLPGGDGSKTVYLRLSDRAGNRTTVPLTVTLDTVVPSASVTIQEGLYATERDVRLIVSGSDASGLKELCLANDDAAFTDCRDWGAAFIDWTLAEQEGARKVRIRVRDAAGNTREAQDTITLDTTPPTLTASTTSGRVVNGTRFVKSGALALQFTYADGSGSGVQKLEFSSDGVQWSSPIDATTTLNITPTGADGERTQYVRAIDRAGLRSDPKGVAYVLDTTAPTAQLVINGGASAVSGTAVSLGLTASDGAGSGLDTMAFANENAPSFSAAEPFAATKAWTINSETTTHTVRAQVTDNAGNSVTVQDDILLDPNVPQVSCTIAGGARATSASSVALSCTVITIATLSSLTAKDGTGSAVAFPTPWPSPGSAGPVALTLPLAATEGTHTITVEAVMSTTSGKGTATGTIIRDTTAPALTAVSLASGASFTRTQAVTLAVTVTPDSTGSALSQICMGTTAGFTGGCTAYAASTGYQLAAGDGTKTVYVKVVDEAGNTSAVANDAIVLDATPPASATVSIAGGAAYLGSGADVSVSVSASDAASGLASVAFSTDNGATFGAEQEMTTSPASFTADLGSGSGAKTLVARVKDAAGNTALASDDVIVDTTPPTGQVAINAGAAWTTTTAVTASLAATDDGQVAKYCLKLASQASAPVATDSCWTTFAASAAVTLSGEGQKSVYAWFKDAAGNASTSEATDAIGVDLTDPTIGAFTLAGGAAFTKTNPAPMALTGADGTGSGVAQYCTGTTNPPTACQGTAPATVGLLSGDGLRTAYAMVKDTAGRSSAVATQTVTFDGTAPTVSIVVNGGQAYTSSSPVTVAITASDGSGSGLDKYAYAVAGGSYTSDTAFAASFPATLGTTGVRPIAVRVTDKLGSSAVATGSVTWDTQKPSGTITLNDGAPQAASTALKVGLTYTDDFLVADVCVKNSSGAPAANDACWRTATQTIDPFTVPTGDGTKLVYAWFRDGAGNMSATEAVDSIVVDTSFPVVSSLVAANNALWTNNVNVALSLTASTPAPGTLAQVCVGAGASGGAQPVLTCSTYTTTPAVTLPAGDGQKTIYAKVINAANNESPVRTTTIGLDQTPPTLSAVAIASGAAWVNTLLNVPVTLTASDGTSGSGVLNASFSTAGPTTGFGPAMPVAAGLTTSLATGTGVKTLWAKVIDAAGNPSTTASDTVNYDNTPPSGSLVLNGGAAWTNNATNASVGLTYADEAGGSGVTQVCLKSTSSSTVPASNDPCWRAAAATIAPYSLGGGAAGSVSVYARFLDAAGNASSEYVDAIGVDTRAPNAVTSVVVTGGHRTLTATWAAGQAETEFDDDSPLLGHRVSVSTDGGTTWTYGPLVSPTTFSSSVSGRFPNGATAHVRVSLFDQAGNETATTPVQAQPRYPFDFRGRPVPPGALFGLAQGGPAGSPVYVAVGAGGLVLRSTNAGAAWTRVDPLVDGQLQGIAFKPGTSKGVVVGYNGAVGYTTDAGQTWRFGSIDLLGADLLYGVAYVSSTTAGGTTTDRWVAVGAGGGLYRADLVTYGGAEAWTSVALPSGTTATALRDVDVCTSCATTSGGSLVYVAGDNIILSSNDQGQSYTKLDSCTAAATAVDATPDGSELFTVCDATIKSQKAGVRTSRGSTPSGLTVNGLVAQTDLSVELFGYGSGGYGQVYATTWTAAAPGTPSSAIEPAPSDMKEIKDGVATATSIIVVADPGDIAYRSSPVWVRPSTFNLGAYVTAHAVARSGTQAFFALSNGQVHRYDSGASADQVSSVFGNALRAIGVGPSSIFVAGDFGRWTQSSDLNGTSWNGMSYNSSYTNYSWLAMDCNVSNNRCVISGQQGGEGYIQGSSLSLQNNTNGTYQQNLRGIASFDGSPANTVAVGAGGIILRDMVNRVSLGSGTSMNLNGVASTGSVWIAVGDGGTVLRATTINGSGNWTAVTMPAGFSKNLQAVSVKGSVWLAVGDGTVVRSDDQGQHWREIYAPSAKLLNGVTSDGTSTWLAGDGGTMAYAPRPWEASFEPGRVVGQLEDLKSGNALTGYACAVTVAQSLTVDLYVDGLLDKGGVLLATVTANLTGDAVSDATCLNGTGFAHRFSYTPTSAQLTQYPGKTIYAYGRSPIGLTNNRVAGSARLP